jgi:hypothetical protein
MARYRIICLQNAPLYSWGGFYSERQLRDKFSEYSLLEWDYYPGKNWFTLKNIEDYWDVRFERVSLFHWLREKLSDDRQLD